MRGEETWVDSASEDEGGVESTAVAFDFEIGFSIYFCYRAGLEI